VSTREVSALDIARREMNPGEKLIWAERPIASVHALSLPKTQSGMRLLSEHPIIGQRVT
jgi:hypothetical protein